MTSNDARHSLREAAQNPDVVESSRVSEPQRTCIGCRGKGGRSLLLRVVTCDDAGTLVLDRSRSMPGRGAWLHPQQDCLNKAVQRRAWGRALRLKVAVKTESLEAQMAEEISTMSSDDDETSGTTHVVRNDHDRKRD